LFKAIRQVIQDDLADEDELCMAVEDLGIETEEVSCTQAFLTYSRLRSLKRSSALFIDITLTQILNLREKLLRNDGVESFRPMYIILGTRTNFSKRLENLIAGAAEGKGLSQLVAWDEHSESLDDLGGADESKNDVESTLEGRELDTVPGIEEAADQAVHSSDNSAPEESVPEHEQETKAEPSDDTKLRPDESIPTARDGSAKDFTPTDANPTSLSAVKQNEDPSKEGYDEDDLIDYSEEERDDIPAIQRHVKSTPTDSSRTNHGTYNFISPCLKPNACFCSKCTILLLAEYEAINEDLRRRSISRTTEDRAFEQSNEQATAANEGDYEGSYFEENGIEYEERNEHQEELENDDLNAVHEDFTTGDFDAVGSLEQFDDAGLLADEFGGEGEFADEVVGDSFDEFGAEGQEYNYDDEDSFEDDNRDRPSLLQDEASVGNSQNSILRDPNSILGAEVTEDNLEQADTAESSVTIGPDEIQYGDGPDEEVFDNSKPTAEHQALHDEKEHAAGVEHEDEIDYEDDEVADEANEKKDPGATTPLTAAPVLPTSNGKRSRAEVETDDDPNVSNKGTYWPFIPKWRRIH
jgi:hypothetical protein